MEQTAAYCSSKGSQFFDEASLGVSYDEYIIIDTISFNIGICQRDLSKMILKDRSYTSRVLNGLESRDLVLRKIEEKGKRLVKNLYLTKKGEQILEKTHEKLKKAFLDLFKEISDEEFESIRNGLEKMKDCISKYTKMPL